jgi:uncharacterized protein with PIN domain
MEDDLKKWKTTSKNGRQPKTKTARRPQKIYWKASSNKKMEDNLKKIIRKLKTTSSTNEKNQP